MRIFFDVFRPTSHINFLLSLIFIFFGPLINVFLRVLFDVFRQTLHINFLVYLIFFFFNIIFFYPCKTFSCRSFLTFFDKLRILISSYTLFLYFLNIIFFDPCKTYSWRCFWRFSNSSHNRFSASVRRYINLRLWI